MQCECIFYLNYLQNSNFYLDMKRTTRFATILCACFLSIVFNACKANVDLNNIDMTTSVETSLSLPLGSINLKLGDFIGDSTIQGVMVDENGQYIYSNTITFSEDIKLFDLDDIDTRGNYTLDFAKEVLAVYPHYKDLSIPAGHTLNLTFPIGISLSNMNANADEQRLDSLVVDFIRFYTKISANDFALSNKDIKKLEVEIENGFRCKAGNTINVPIESYGLNKDIPIELEDIHIVLMGDPHQEPSITNLLDSIHIKVHMQITTSQELKLNSSSTLSFGIYVDELDYDAVFGYVHMPTLIQDSIIDYPIEKFWAGWKAFDGTILPLSKPSLLFTIEHGFSIPLAATVNALNVSSKEGEYRHVTFDGQKSKTFTFPSKIAMDAPYDATTIDSVRIDYTESNGNIDELLTIHPTNVSYNYMIGIDANSTQKQYRITDNTHIDMALDIQIPFEFNNNVYFAYSDTIRDINLTAFQLDSLLAEAEFIENVEKAELKLYLDIENWVPFNIEAIVTFFAEDGTKIQISSMEEDKINLKLAQPKSIVDGYVKEASTNQIILNVTKEDFEKIASINYIELKAQLKDNDTLVKLTPEAAIIIKAGVTANIKAIVDVNGLL